MLQSATIAEPPMKDQPSQTKPEYRPEGTRREEEKPGARVEDLLERLRDAQKRRKERDRRAYSTMIGRLFQRIL
jgi:hypothetical protein